MSNVTLKMLTDYLERFGWSRYQAVDEPFEQEGIIYTGWHNVPDGPSYRLTIDPMVERGCLVFRVPNLLEAPQDENPERLADLTKVIGYINYRIILGKFAYDPRDGEVRFSVDVPIDENTFTYAQFLHVMRVVIETTEIYAPRLQAIWAGELTAQQFIEQDIGAEMSRMRSAFTEFLRQLLDALESGEQDDESSEDTDAERKRRSKDGDDDDLREI